MTKLLILILFTSVLFNCTKDNELTLIDSDIIVKIEQSNDKIYLKATTEDIYPHSGFFLDYSIKKNLNSTTIEFTEIRSSGGGLTVLSHARTQIDIELLRNNKSKLKFKLNGIITEGMFKTDPLLLEIEEGSNVKTN